MEPKFVFSSNRGGNFQLYLLSVKDGNVVQLTWPPGTSYGASWSPHGDKLAFTQVDASIPYVAIANLCESEVANIRSAMIR